jgi:glycosyltransferase involved in cell wall biosynthesis
MNIDLSAIKVSIGMSTFNSKSTIGRAIESLFSQIHQNWELIIVDAHSEDNTTEIIRSFAASDSRISYSFSSVRQDWVKCSADQLSTATGDFFMWLDADDFISPEWITTLLVLLENKDYICAIGLLELVDSKGYLVNNNPSTLRSFNFTTNKFGFIRVGGAILHPESFGLVNILYGLWRTESLRLVRKMTPENSILHFDRIFLLNAMKTGRIKYSSKTFHFRTSLSEKIKIGGLSLNASNINYYIKSPKKIRLIEFIWLSMKNWPPVDYYFPWIRKEKIFYRFTYSLGLLIRVIIASPIYILKLNKFNRIKFY